MTDYSNRGFLKAQMKVKWTKPTKEKLDATGIPALQAQLADARVIAGELNRRLAVDFSLSEDTAPISALNMAANQFTILLEQISFYVAAWLSHQPVSITQAEVNATREENTQRIVKLMNSAFISMLSSYEYVAKKVVLQNPEMLPMPKKRIYFGWIIENSSASELIPKEDLKAWQGLIEFRNALVHNDAISDKTEWFDVPGTKGITFVEGEMIKSDFPTYIGVMMWALHAYFRWCVGVLQWIKATR